MLQQLETLKNKLAHEKEQAIKNAIARIAGPDFKVTDIVQRIRVVYMRANTSEDWYWDDKLFLAIGPIHFHTKHSITTASREFINYDV